MSAGDVLFVPSGGAVSWRAKGDDAKNDEAIALRFCYVDASNFNSVKSQLPLYAAVEVCSTSWPTDTYHSYLAERDSLTF